MMQEQQAAVQPWSSPIHALTQPLPVAHVSPSAMEAMEQQVWQLQAQLEAAK
jgi:hypothetical protein